MDLSSGRASTLRTMTCFTWVPLPFSPPSQIHFPLLADSSCSRWRGSPAECNGKRRGGGHDGGERKQELLKTNGSTGRSLSPRGLRLEEVAVVGVDGEV